MAAATNDLLPLGICDRMLCTKYTLQRCHVTPTSTSSIANSCPQAFMGINGNQFHAFQPYAHQATQEIHSECRFLVRTHRKSRNIPFTSFFHTYRDDLCLAHNEVILTNLQIERIQPQVKAASFRRMVVESFHQLVQFLTNPGNLALNNPDKPKSSQ
jgi:hypothetical protein